MKVDISDIVKINGAYLDLKFSDNIEDLNTSVSDFIFGKPLNFKGQLVNAGGVLKLDGCLNLEYEGKCYRCLKDVYMSMDIAVREEFLKEEAVKDGETYTYTGSCIEMDRVFKDNIILNLPMKVVCTEDCKGLCPHCGSDLNLTGCGCREEAVNPRMEALKKYFDF